MAPQPPVMPKVRGFLGLTNGDKIRRPRVLNKEGKEVAFNKLIEEVMTIAQKRVLEATEPPPTMILMLDLFNEVMDSWFDDDMPLFFLISPKRRWSILGCLTTAFVLGKFMGQQEMEVEEFEMDQAELKAQMDSKDIFPLYRDDEDWEDDGATEEPVEESEDKKDE